MTPLIPLSAFFGELFCKKNGGARKIPKIITQGVSPRPLTGALHAYNAMHKGNDFSPFFPFLLSFFSFFSFRDPLYE
jgi:hypothetical protein